MTGCSNREIWRPVVGRESEYEVSNLGRVRSLDRVRLQRGRSGKLHKHRSVGRLLKPGISSSGYPTVALGRGNTRLLHDLVAEAFIRPRGVREVVRHIDGTRDNSRADNLVWGSYLDNITDAKKHGTWGAGVLKKCKLSIEEREVVKALRDVRNFTVAKLAETFQVSRATIVKTLGGRHAEIG